MHPNKNEWHSWSPMEKVSYVAQVLATLSLFPTVLFAWLGWQEAKIARSEQFRLLLAEKPPHIVAEPALSEGHFFIVLENTGSTPAEIKRVLLTEQNDSREIVDLHITISDEPGVRSILPNRKAEYLFPQIGIEGSINWKPGAVKKYDLVSEVDFSKNYPRMKATVWYEDLAGKVYTESITVVFEK